MSALYKIGAYIIVPSHGLGKLVNKVSQVIGENEMEFLEIFFEQDNMKMLVPFAKAKKSGLRPPVSKLELDDVFDILKQNSHGMRVIWSKRSREYNKKIITGDIKAIAEVVRDLFRNTNNPNRSYSERVIFEKALQRLTSEVAVVLEITNEQAEAKIVDILSKYHETFMDTQTDEYYEQLDQEDDMELEQLPQSV